MPRKKNHFVFMRKSFGFSVVVWAKIGCYSAVVWVEIGQKSAVVLDHTSVRPKQYFYRNTETPKTEKKITETEITEPKSYRTKLLKQIQCF